MARLAFLFLFLVSCADLNQKLDPRVNYPKDLKIKVNGHKGVGTLVVPIAPVYNFEVTSLGKLDLFAYSTCHREKYQEKAWDDGWFSSEYETKFEYRPNAVERGHCPLQMGAYEKKKGRHGWGLIDFEDGSSNLPALISCNGDAYNSRGVTLCQSKAGLLQKIEFNEPVLYSPPGGCPISKVTEDKIFEIILPRGECVYMFLEKKKDSNRSHRLTTYGYDEIILRED